MRPKPNQTSVSRGTLWKKLRLLGVSIFLTLLAVELALRGYHYHRRNEVLHQLQREESDLAVVQSDVPGLIYTYRPCIDKANSQGYLDEEHAMQKKDGVFRIVVIGDSIAVGHKVKVAKSFTQVLERRLNEAYGEDGMNYPHFEIVVLARGGYSTTQELVLLRREAFLYDPDLILWCYCLNDPAHPLFNDTSGELTDMYQPPVYLWHLVMQATHCIDVAIRAYGGPQEFHKRLHYVHADQVAANIATIGELCRQQKVPVVFAIHPVFRENAYKGGFKRYKLQLLHEKLRVMAAESGMHVVDLLDAYYDYQIDEVSFPNDSWHPNVHGHRIVAEYLDKWMKRKALIPDVSLEETASP